VDHTQNELVIDGDVLAGELVAKADDLPCLNNLFKQFHLSLGKLGKCLTNEDQLPLKR
jgi:hypothetical protein